MSMDTCKACGDFVDTDFDVDCYDNPAEQCHCERCREAGEPIDGWLAIETAPHDREVELASYIVPSPAAVANGSWSFWDKGKGRHLWGDKFTGILGSTPSHWREV